MASFLSECEAHPKDGFFIEAGFETGLIESKERLISKQKPNNLNIISSPPIKKQETPNNTKNTNNAEGIIEIPKNSIVIDEAPSKDNPNGESIVEVPSSDGKIHANTKIDIDNQEVPAQKIAPDVVEVNGGNITPQDSPNASSNTGASKNNYPTLNTNATTFQATSISKDTYKSQQLLTDSSVTNYYNAFTTLRPVKTMLLDKNAAIPKDEDWSGANSLDNITALTKESLSNQNIVIQNFLPYDLNNVELIIQAKDSSGKVIEVPLATFENIAKNTEITLSADTLKNLEQMSGGVDIYDFKFKSTDTSNQETKTLFTNLDKITTNISGRFNDDMATSGYAKWCGTTCYQNVTPIMAQQYVNNLLNLAAVLDSNEWQKAIENAPGFSSASSRGTHWRSVDAKEVIERFRADSNFLRLKVLRPWEQTTLWGLGDRNLLAVDPKALDPTYAEIHLNPDLVNGNVNSNERFSFHVFLHEFAHTKGFSHYGSFTHYRENGFTDLTMKTWAELNKSNALPINYRELYAHGEKIGNFQPKSINQYALNLSAYANHSVNTINEVSTNSPQPARFDLQSQYALDLSEHINRLMNTIGEVSVNNPIQNKNYSNAMLGFNAKMGYQKYFNDYVGLAYYAMVKYNYAKSSGYAGVIQQVGVGGGVDLLLDFYTSYDNKSVKSAFGIFGGLRGLYNGYSLLKNMLNTGNLDVAIGLNYRYKKSKYSIGIAVPLVQQNLKLSLSDSMGAKEIELKTGASHFNVFFNYGWVF
ncbi:hypothetical protein [Helicobacter cetorum]|uniref:hypothetical protein n=1 Tax=Helicobacter cetorum TaxID=138563 RepID=UPI001315468F|nr:hypothetical protein [Helicobacter cetorum]